MTRVVPTMRRKAVVAGTLGLAAVGAAAGAVPAHAAEAGGGIGSGPMLSLRTLLSPASDTTRLGLDQLPVVGGLPTMLEQLPVSAVPPIVPAALKSPGARSRMLPASPMSAPAADGTEPEARGLGVLPLMSNVPLVDAQKSSQLLAKLTGGDLGGLAPLASLTRGLGGIASLG